MWLAVTAGWSYMYMYSDAQENNKETKRKALMTKNLHCQYMGL